MHIGLIIYGRVETLTGGWIYDRRLVEHLRLQGHSVTLISLQQRSYLRSLADNLSRSVYRRLCDHDCRLLVEDGLVHPSLVGLNQRIKGRLDIPVVTIVHQVLCRRPSSRLQGLIFEAIEGRYLKSVDGFIFNSETTRTHVDALVGRQRPAVVANPGGDRLGSLACDASDQLVSSRSRKPGPLQLVCVANLTPNKGILPLIEGLSRLPRDIWRLTLIGDLAMDPAYAKAVKALIARLGLDDRIEIKGPLDGRQLAERLNAAQLFVLPFSYESFGMACLEAMAWGLPVVASSRGAVGEFVVDGINGALTSPGDIAGFAGQIKRLHDDRNLLASYGQAAFKTFRSRPGWRDSLRKIESFLLKMAP